MPPVRDSLLTRKRTELPLCISYLLQWQPPCPTPGCAHTDTTHGPWPLLTMQTENLAQELVSKLPHAALASLLTLSTAGVAKAADFYAPPAESNTTTVAADKQQQSMQFGSAAPLTAPEVKAEYQLPEGTQWRYSDFVGAVEKGKVERVRFSKDGTQLQLTAVDGRRATVVLPNDPELVDILARNGVDISVSEGDQQGNYVALLGNILFPLIAFGGLFFLFRRGQGGTGGGPMGPMGGAMDFGRSKSKFQEVPETGVMFEDVAVSARGSLQAHTACMGGAGRACAATQPWRDTSAQCHAMGVSLCAEAAHAMPCSRPALRCRRRR